MTNKRKVTGRRTSFYAEDLQKRKDSAERGALMIALIVMIIAGVGIWYAIAIDNQKHARFEESWECSEWEGLLEQEKHRDGDIFKKGSWNYTLRFDRAEILKEYGLCVEDKARNIPNISFTCDIFENGYNKAVYVDGALDWSEFLWIEDLNENCTKWVKVRTKVSE